eukprot:403365594
MQQSRTIKKTQSNSKTKLAILCAFIVISSVTQHTNAGSRATVGKEIVDEIASKQQDWDAMPPDENPFKGYAKEDFQSLLGISKRAPSLFLADSSFYKPKANGVTIPKTYDSRKIYKNCIHGVLDQVKCSACWAFAIAQVVSDRFCIVSNSTTDVVLSYQNLISCVNPKIFGCKIGVIDVAFQYMEKTGIMSDQCMPYTAQEGPNATIEACRTKCNNASDSNRKYQCKKGSFKVAQGADDIKAMLVDKGSIFVTFDVFEDFFNYRRGIYRYTTGELVGYHACKLIGWGYDWFRDTNYYIIENSWGTEWGMKGFFNVAVGEINVDKFGYTCDPLI